MGLFSRKKPDRRKMTYTDHAYLYWTVLKDKVNEQYGRIKSNPDLLCNTAPVVVKMEMIILAHSIDLVIMDNTFSSKEFDKLLKSMNNTAQEALELSEIETFFHTTQMYANEFHEAQQRKMNPIMQGASVLRQRCNFHGPDYMETTFIANSISRCCNKWSSIKEDIEFVDDNVPSKNAANLERFLGPAKQRINIIVNLSDRKLSPEKVAAIIAMIDEPKGLDYVQLREQISFITDNILTEDELEQIIYVASLTKNNQLDSFLSMLGAGTSGVDSDEIPGGEGEFGYAATNPIPTKGISGSEQYLSMLRTTSGSRVAWQRIGSLTVKNIEQPIDKYLIKDSKTGQEVGIIHLSPYHRRNSSKAPLGLYLIINVQQ